MKVFIAWSKDQSRRLAQVLNTSLKVIIQNLETFFSEEDIEVGTRWFEIIENQLNECNTGILCLTPENKDATWLMFESGAISKQVERAKVISICFGLKTTDVSPPLSMFQNIEFNKANFYKLLMELNKNIEKPLEQKILEQSLDSNWNKLEEEVNKILSTSQNTSGEKTRKVEDMVEELLTLTRNDSYMRPTKLYKDLEKYILDLFMEYAYLINSDSSYKDGYSKEEITPLFNKIYNMAIHLNISVFNDRDGATGFERREFSRARSERILGVKQMPDVSIEKKDENYKDS